MFKFFGCPILFMQIKKQHWSKDWKHRHLDPFAAQDLTNDSNSSMITNVV